MMDENTYQLHQTLGEQDARTVLLIVTQAVADQAFISHFLGGTIALDLLPSVLISW